MTSIWILVLEISIVCITPYSCLWQYFTVIYINKDWTHVSSKTIYLTTDILNQSNLVVVIDATITRILFEKNSNETKTIGIEFIEKSVSFGCFSG